MCGTAASHHPGTASPRLPPTVYSQRGREAGEGLSAKGKLCLLLAQAGAGYRPGGQTGQLGMAAPLCRPAKAFPMPALHKTVVLTTLESRGNS